MNKQVECPFCGSKVVEGNVSDCDHATVFKCWDCDSLFEQEEQEDGSTDFKIQWDSRQTGRNLVYVFYKAAGFLKTQGYTGLTITPLSEDHAMWESLRDWGHINSNGRVTIFDPARLGNYGPGHRGLNW